MVSTQSKAFVGTALLVFGAFAVGNAIHQSVVVGAYAPTAPGAVLQGLAGLGAIVVGHRLYRPANAYIETDADADTGADSDPGGDGAVRETEESVGEAPELSPLEDEDLERLDADDPN